MGYGLLERTSVSCGGLATTECRYLRQGYSDSPKARNCRLDELCTCDKGYYLAAEVVRRCRSNGYTCSCWMRDDIHYQRQFQPLLAWKGFFRKEHIPQPA